MVIKYVQSAQNHDGMPIWSYIDAVCGLPTGLDESVEKALLGRAANMGTKISLLLYEWPLIKCKIWYMNGSIFQNVPKFEPKLAQL